MNEVLFFEDDVVKISPQAIKYTPFSAMYKSDRTKDHNRFSDAITLIFFMHSRTSIYRRRTPGIRKNFIANNVFKKDLDFVINYLNLKRNIEKRNYLLKKPIKSG